MSIINKQLVLSVNFLIYLILWSIWPNGGVVGGSDVALKFIRNIFKKFYRFSLIPKVVDDDFGLWISNL